MLIGITCPDTGDPGATVTSADVTIGTDEQTTPAVGQMSLAMGHKLGPASGTATAAFTYGSSQGGFIALVALKALARGDRSGWVTG
jgi:hypothetical protein